MQATTACTVCIALSVLLLYVALDVAPDDGNPTTTKHLPTSSTARTATTNGLFCYAVATRAEAPDDSFSPLRGVRASSPLRGARAPSPLARQWILGATPV